MYDTLIWSFAGPIATVVSVSVSVYHVYIVTQNGPQYLVDFPKLPFKFQIERKTKWQNVA